MFAGPPLAIIGSTVNFAVTASSNRVALTAVTAAPRTVVITSVGANVIFIAFGDATITASTATGFPLLPNSANAFSVGPTDTHVAAIAGATGNTLYASSGIGQ